LCIKVSLLLLKRILCWHKLKRLAVNLSFPKWAAVLALIKLQTDCDARVSEFPWVFERDLFAVSAVHGS
jgi:hypothetical protein